LMPRGSIAKVGESGESYDREFFNPWRDFCERLPHMIDGAQDERRAAYEISEGAKHPLNHRGFYVGVSVLAFDTLDKTRRHMYEDTAVNTMPIKSGPRVCAEKRAIDRIQKENRSPEKNLEVIGVVIIGEPQPDGATNYHSETLWPCGEVCWPNIVAKKFAKDALLVTVRPDKRKGQVQTAEELDSFYSAVLRGESPSEPNLFHHSEDEWKEIVRDFDNLIPRNVDPFASTNERHASVEAARVAIQGFSKLRLV
jgi:hypothetical protein